MTINQPFPFDKLVVIPYILYQKYNGISLSTNQKVILVILGITAFLSFALNLNNPNFQIFYPIIFLAAAFYMSQSRIDLLVIRRVLFVNILFGLICALCADFQISNPYSRTLLEKGLPFLYSPLGFSPTNQVFGTFCIAHLMISFECRKFDFFAWVALIAMLMTLNRASLVFLFCLLFYYRRKWLFVLPIFIIYALIKYWQDIEIFFSSGTLDSRDLFRESVDQLFWKSNDVKILLFGFGNTVIQRSSSMHTYYDSTYIENGLDFIAYIYGYVGLFIVFCIIITWIVSRGLKKKWKIVSFILVYYLIEQWLTNEFQSSSFMFITAILALIQYRAYRLKIIKIRKKIHIHGHSIHRNSNIQCS